MRDTIIHPEFGEMFNSTRSAAYLGVTRNKFRRIAPPPDFMRDGIYPFWAKRVLDILPTEDGYDYQETLAKGRACGRFLVGDLNKDEVRALQARLGGFHSSKTGSIGDLISILQGFKINMRFTAVHEAKVFCEGMLSTIKAAILDIDNPTTKKTNVVLRPSVSERLKSRPIDIQLEWQKLKDLFGDHEESDESDWLAFWDGDLVGRVSGWDEHYWASLEGALPHADVGGFLHRAEALAAVEKAVRQAMASPD